MGTFSVLLVSYVVGGVTFLPLLVCLLLLHAHLTFPHATDESQQPTSDVLRDASDDGQNMRPGNDAHDSKFHRENEKESAGYFAVCREWIPGGINGKPPERTTPAGEVIAEESPSVYQSMYRSIFERKQVPSMDIAKQNGRPVKRTRNLFYIVLRHRHLMLYDDSEQVEVRHVISLSHHDVSIYGGEEDIPEGELWIKRNAICLSRKAMSHTMVGSTSKPFYLFSENCSDKEDFYFALLQNQERVGTDQHLPPLVQHFEVKHIINLVQRLHSSEEQLQTRWVNALVGRLFLGMYKTQEIEDLIRLKITKKISRVNKPAFISGIVLKKIDTGNSAPFITNPRLKDLTVEGDCTVEMDVSYTGNFRIEVGTTAKIDLGARFKAREVNLVLAIMLKKLQGHLLVRFKPPPSNRFWISFETMPHMETNIEPIVSSRQITYGIIIRAIESRIREVLAETLVLPHWDDSPFMNTKDQYFRGGIWVNERRNFQPPTETVVPDDTVEDVAESQESATSEPQAAKEHTVSTPVLAEAAGSSGLFARKGHKSKLSTTEDSTTAASSGVQKSRNDPPRAIRSNSFASAADPIVSTDHINSSPTRPDSRQAKDASSIMTEISSRSQAGSPADTPFGSYGSTRSLSADKDQPSGSAWSSAKAGDSDIGSSQSTLPSPLETLFAQSPPNLSSRSTASSIGSASSGSSKFQSVARGLTPSEKKQQTLAAAAMAAKDWGWRTIARGRGPNLPTRADRPGTPEFPMGRGRPLPPPGTPLPPPDKCSSTSSRALPKRKPLPAQGPAEVESVGVKTIPTPSPRSSPQERFTSASQVAEDGIFVVEAPRDSAPTSPLTDDVYGEFMDNVKSDDDDDAPTPSQDENVPVEDHKSNMSSDDTTYRNDELQPGRRSLSTSYGGNANGIASWESAQEAEARDRSVWMDEQEHP
jgi:hypothetical protein